MNKLISSLLISLGFLFTTLPAFSGTVIIESWRNDDADAWNNKILSLIHI